MAQTGTIGDSHRVHLGTLSLIRWAAIAGQAAAILIVHFGLGFSLPLTAALATVAASVVVNLTIPLQFGRKPAAESSVAFYLAFDIVQLTVLLYLTGGLENPFAFLLLAPVAVSATVLSLASTAALSGLALVAVGVLAVEHFPLPWRGPPPTLPTLYVLGVWSALAIGIVFFAVYTWRVAEAARRLSDGLAATQLALAREQQLSAVGAMAAAAAHELGSPLGTIAIVARELERDVSPDSPFAEDIRLLSSEAARCRDILAELARDPAGDQAPFSRVPVGAVVESAALRHDSDTIDLILESAPEPGTELGTEPGTEASGEPHIASSPEIIHGLGNLVQNAVQFARSAVTVHTSWDSQSMRVVIRDDGPGFPTMILERVGEPYLSHRAPLTGRTDGSEAAGDKTGGRHMGLGIFIARTLLIRTGATLEFHNRASGGAEVEVRWERAILEDTKRQETARGPL